MTRSAEKSSAALWGKECESRKTEKESRSYNTSWNRVGRPHRHFAPGYLTLIYLFCLWWGAFHWALSKGKVPCLALRHHFMRLGPQKLLILKHRYCTAFFFQALQTETGAPQWQSWG